MPGAQASRLQTSRRRVNHVGSYSFTITIPSHVRFALCAQLQAGRLRSRLVAPGLHTSFIRRSRASKRGSERRLSNLGLCLIKAKR